MLNDERLYMERVTTPGGVTKYVGMEGRGLVPYQVEAGNFIGYYDGYSRLHHWNNFSEAQIRQNWEPDSGQKMCEDGYYRKKH